MKVQAWYLFAFYIIAVAIPNSKDDLLFFLSLILSTTVRCHCCARLATLYRYRVAPNCCFAHWICETLFKTFRIENSPYIPIVFLDYTILLCSICNMRRTMFSISKIHVCRKFSQHWINIATHGSLLHPFSRISQHSIE